MGKILEISVQELRQLRRLDDDIRDASTALVLKAREALGVRVSVLRWQ